MPKSLTSSQKLAWQLILEILKNHISNVAINCKDFEKIDQAFLHQLLKQHRLQLIAFPILKNLLPSSHPFLIQLQQKNLNLISRYFQQKKALIKIAKQFESNNIAYVSLKGPALNDLLYQDRCLRQSNDLDILIAPQEALKAHVLLQRAGFQVSCEKHLASIEKYPLHFSHFVKDITYVDKEKYVAIELHFRTNHVKEIGFQFHAEYEVEKLSLLSQEINILPTEENFLYLCLHGAKHQWSSLQWLIDLAKFIKNFSINWKKLFHLAVKQHCVRPLLELKILLAEFFTLEIPDFKTSSLDWLTTWLHLKYLRTQWLSDPSAKNRFYRNMRGIFINSLLYTQGKHKLQFIYNTRLSQQDPCRVMNKNFKQSKL